VLCYPNAMPKPNWSRALPEPICILDDGKEFLRLTTLADVRGFLKHLPRERRQSYTWHVAVRRLEAAAVGSNVDDLLTALQIAFQLERIEYR